MHLPTINYIEISSFPLSGPTSCDNLHQLNIYAGRENGSLEIVQPEKMFREFRIFYSALVTTKLLHAKLQAGRPAINFMNLRRLSMSFFRSEDEQK